MHLSLDDIILMMNNHAKMGFTGALGSFNLAGCKLDKGAVEDQRKNIGKPGCSEPALECIPDDRF